MNFLVSLLFFGSSALAFEKGDLWVNAKDGKYTKLMQTTYDHWLTSAQKIKNPLGNELLLSVVPTEGNKTYIGIIGQMTIQSSLQEVLQVLRKVDEYQKIYVDLEKVTLTNTAGADQCIDWNFKGPMGTHTQYQTVQRIDSLNKKAALIYQLKKSAEVLENDGFILLEETALGVHFFSVDFLNAKWGFFGKMFKNQIWNTTCENTVKALTAIKKLAEDKNPKKIKSEIGKDFDCGKIKNRKEQKSFENLVVEILD